MKKVDLIPQIDLKEKAQKRIESLKNQITLDPYVLCIEKAKLITESWQKTDGDPPIIRLAKAFEHLLKNYPIFIKENELIVGNAASLPRGIEIDCFFGPIYEEELKKLEEEGLITIPKNVWFELREIIYYWRDKNLQYKIGQVINDKLWQFAQSGILLPPFRSKEEGVGGFLSSGLYIGIQRWIGALDFESVLTSGLNYLIMKAEEELENIRFEGKSDALKKVHFLQAAIISLKAIIAFANRFAELAKAMAIRENNPDRKKELEKIAEVCKQVPANAARNFHEAIQSFWFITLVTPWQAFSTGRFDQYMYPFYKKDIEKRISDSSDILELLCLLRIKDMELVALPARAVKRQQYAGLAKWHNMVIGGVDKNGRDATNELTYLILEAAKRVRTPHHTITLRVHETTPEELMLKAIEVVKTGIGMPAFVGDKSYIEFLLMNGVPLEEARNYVVAGCIEASIPAKSRQSKCTFFVFPKVLEIFLNGGIDPRTGFNIGPFEVDIEKFGTFEDFYETFKKYITHFTKLAAELINIDLACSLEFASPVDSILMIDSIKEGKNLFEREMLYENIGAISQCGLINVGDSLAAIKKLIFEEKLFTMRELKEALKNNWEGYENIRTLCLKAPKYGNDDDYVDEIVSDLYKAWVKTLSNTYTILGKSFKPAAISITSQWLGGAITGATPDGRKAGEVLADGGASPMRGRDVRGPTAVIKSASKIDQTCLQSVLLNMKFHPSALKSVEDMKKLSILIKTYFRLGGKHIQFNVIDKNTLIEAQKHPEYYKDLIVRVAGFSAYFVQLSKEVQDEIIARTEHCI